MSSKIYLAISRQKRKSPNSYIIGIDEVGRGPLAGPVTVAAVAIPRLPFKKRVKRNFPPLRDSKKLSAKQREIWFKWAKNQKISFATASVSPKIIDKINISNAANLAATKAFKKLTTNSSKLTAKNCKIFLDGGLYLCLEKFKFKNLKIYNSIIKGDEKIPAIALASIVAKVHRDAFMEKMDKKYPRYGFKKHKGYGTKTHFEKIKNYGLSEIHRISFLKNIKRGKNAK